MAKYIVALQVGGVMEQLHFTYHQTIEANSEAEAEEFLTNLIGQTLQVVEITDEYKDTEVPTYKCKFITSGEIVMRYGSYFPFVDADLTTLAE